MIIRRIKLHNLNFKAFPIIIVSFTDHFYFRDNTINKNDLENLKNLKDEGTISQEEFNKHLSEYLDTSNNEKIQIHSNFKYLIYLIFICIITYFISVYIFYVSYSCPKNTSPEACTCLKTSILKNTTFMDKVEILFTGASWQKARNYLNISDAFRCAIIDNYDAD